MAARSNSLTPIKRAAVTRQRPKILRGIRSNVGIEQAYRKRLEGITEQLHRSVMRFVIAGYRAHTPVLAQDISLWDFLQRKEPAKSEALAQDASPAEWLRRIVSALRRRWTKKIEEAAPKLAEYFAKSVEKRSTDALKKILKDSGIAVDFKMTAAMRDILDATVHENVSLIKSIPSRYFDSIEQIVARGVTTGNDLKQITDDLQREFGVSRRRAAFIASDQATKCNSALTAERQRSIGVRKGILRHSHAGKTPRRVHLEMDGKEFDLDKGFWDPHAIWVKGSGWKGKMVMPGELINCFPGSTRIKFAQGVKKAFRYWHSGELAEIVTDTGETFSATLNHPILTPRGWIAIGLLEKGDYIVQVTEQSIDSVASEHDDDNAVTSIGDVFNALAFDGAKEVALGARFHGDVVEGDVDIVFAARPLGFGIETSIAQGSFDFEFAVADKAAPGLCADEQFFLGPFHASHSIVGGCGELLPSVRANSIHSDFAGNTAATNCDIVPFENMADSYADTLTTSIVRPFVAQGQRQFTFSSEVSGDNGVFVKLLPSLHEDAAGIGRDRDTAGAQVSADFDKSLPLGQKLCRVVDNVRRSFTGHVYTLETETGWFAVGNTGIVTKNCRCFWSPILPGLEDQFKGENEKESPGVKAQRARAYERAK